MLGSLVTEIQLDDSYMPTTTDICLCRASEQLITQQVKDYNNVEKRKIGLTHFFAAIF